MNRYLLTIIIPVLSAGLFFSCKKNKEHSAPVCQLFSVTDSTTSVQAVTQFSYDNSNRVTSIIITGQNACKRTFQYMGSTVVFSVTDTTPGVRLEMDTITLNSGGFIQTLARHYPTTGESYFQTFLYDAAGVSTGSIQSEHGEPDDTLEYLTVNGDLIYEREKGQAVNKNNFSYYPSKAIVYGDPTDFRQLLYYGAYYYKNVHLLSVLAAPGVSYKGYTYTFNSDNSIAQSTMRLWQAGSADTITHTMNYTYSCK